MLSIYRTIFTLQGTLTRRNEKLRAQKTKAWAVFRVLSQISKGCLLMYPRKVKLLLKTFLGHDPISYNKFNIKVEIKLQKG